MISILLDKKAVIFDLDGTLVDSMWMWRDIDIEFLLKFGITLPEDLQDMIQGMSFTETALYFKDRFSLELSIEEIKEDWNQMAWDKYATVVPLKEGVLRFLDFLKDAGMKLGIATSNSRELVDLVTKNLGIDGYFDSIRTSCEVEQGKPSPDIYLLVAKDLGVEPSTCLVFEDVIHGIMAGKSAGMRVAAIYDQASEQDGDKKKELADYYFNSFEEIFD